MNHTCSMCIMSVALAPALAAASTPNYTGTICPTADGARIEVHTGSDTTLMVIYPTLPSSGGWGMTQDSPGVYSHVINGVEIGDSLRFSLLVQNPQQYTYPEHHAVLNATCSSFERDDVTPPPPRGFRHEVTVDGDAVTVTFHTGTAGLGIPETTSVDITYRLDGGAFTTAGLLEFDQGLFAASINGATGQSMDYWFSQRIGIQPMHTALHTQVLGESITEPSWPIVARQTGRFHHRHPNEWRFDNYVEQYGQGRTFEMEVTDWGNRLDMVVTIDAGLEVGSMDFKYFVENDPYSSTCNRPLSVVNTKLNKNGSVFTGSLEDITPGAIIDFDFAFVDLPADSPISIYYSNFYYYRVGRGLFGPESPNPRAVAVGNATTPNIFSPRFAFAQHAPSLGHADFKQFLAGKLFFETDFENGDLLNVTTHYDCCAGPIGQLIDASPVHQPGRLGPGFSTASCIACHAMDGRGATPYEGDDLRSLVAQLSVQGVGPNGAPIPHPFYGNQLSVQASTGAPEGSLGVHYELQTGTFDDGTPYTLRAPTYAFSDMQYGSLGVNVPDTGNTPGFKGLAEFSPRIAPMLPGLGMLEAIAEGTLLAQADPDDTNGDGISGRVNMVWDEAAQETVIGRFGWKANQPSLRQQAAGAYLLDMGVTSSLYPDDDCGPALEDCPTGGLPEIDAAELDDIAMYLRGLTLPPRRNYNDPNAIAGMHLFKQANCNACHTPRMHTGSTHSVAAFRNMDIEPFTDLLLHDMGPGLADGRPHFLASGSEWRTPPLWGLSYVKHVLGLPNTCDDPASGGAEPNFLHDGRATSLMEAILWHGGEAQAACNVVLAMTATEREQLIAYVQFPFADAIFEQDAMPVCVGDLNGNTLVDVYDLIALLHAWGTAGREDFDGDGAVDVDDLRVLLIAWGPC